MSDHVCTHTEDSDGICDSEERDSTFGESASVTSLVRFSSSYFSFWRHVEKRQKLRGTSKHTSRPKNREKCFKKTRVVIPDVDHRFLGLSEPVPRCNRDFSIWPRGRKSFFSLSTDMAQDDGI